MPSPILRVKLKLSKVCSRFLPGPVERDTHTHARSVNVRDLCGFCIGDPCSDPMGKGKCVVPSYQSSDVGLEFIEHRAQSFLLNLL